MKFWIDRLEVVIHIQYYHNLFLKFGHCHTKSLSPRQGQTIICHIILVSYSQKKRHGNKISTHNTKIQKVLFRTRIDQNNYKISRKIQTAKIGKFLVNFSTIFRIEIVSLDYNNLYFMNKIVWPHFMMGDFVQQSPIGF